MAGTKEGGAKAADTTRKRHGKNFYREIGAIGGAISRGGGFSGNPELAREAGRLGGLKSRRGPGINKNKE